MNDMIRFEPSIRLNVISSEKNATFPPLSPVSASYISIICKNEEAVKKRPKKTKKDLEPASGTNPFLCGII